MSNGTSRMLDGVRVAVLAADGFEQVEVTVPVKALRKAGADVRLISLRPGRIRGMNFIWRGRKLPVDDVVSSARPEDYGALLLPGGFVSPDLLRQSKKAREFVRQIDEMGRPIATLCHGPELLVSAGLVPGRQLTSWPGIADDIRNAGGLWTDADVVLDRNWVASRSPSDLSSFVPAMLNLFAERATIAATDLPRRLHLFAVISRAIGVGALSLLALGVRAAWQRSAGKRIGQRRRRRIGLAIAALGAGTAIGRRLYQRSHA